MTRRGEAAVAVAIVGAGLVLALRDAEPEPPPRPALPEVLETARELGRSEPRRPAREWNGLLELERWGGGDPDLTPLLARPHD